MRALWCGVGLVMLSGCGLWGERRESSPRVLSSQPSSESRGGYYLDDGPGANPPANIDSIPDAVPRAEPLHKGALRPYTVMGRHYVPMTTAAPYRAQGVASWYGRRYHGKPTAIGELYDMYGMSAAHPTLPLPSYVRVTSIASGKTVVVRVNDRGPFIDSRLIDLSYTAAHKLGIVVGGSAQVEVQAVFPGAPLRMPAAELSGNQLQLAAFGSRESAEAYAARLRSDFAWLALQVQIDTRDTLHRVIAGPYPTPDEARLAAEKIAQLLGMKPIVITR